MSSKFQGKMISNLYSQPNISQEKARIKLFSDIQAPSKSISTFLHPTLGPRRLTWIDCIHGLSHLPLPVGFGQWEILAELGGRKKMRSGCLSPGSLPAKSAQVDFLTRGQHSWKVGLSTLSNNFSSSLWVPGTSSFACLSLSPREGNRIPAVTRVKGLHHPLLVSLNPAHIFLKKNIYLFIGCIRS